MASDLPVQYHKIFVYGTLKRGFPNHYKMGNSRFLIGGKTADRIPLVIGGPFNTPFLLPLVGRGLRVSGEIFDVDEPTLKILDDLENVPYYYTRENMKIETTEKQVLDCWVYIKRSAEMELATLPFLDHYPLEDNGYITPQNRPVGWNELYRNEWIKLKESFHADPNSTVKKEGKTTIGIISSFSRGSGNSMTSYRISNYLREANIETYLMDVDELNDDIPNFNKILQTKNIAGLIGVHAFRSGRYMINTNVPFAIVLGGTDVNENLAAADTNNSNNFNKKETIKTCLSRSQVIISFHQSLIDALCKNLQEDSTLMQSLRPKIKVISPSIPYPSKLLSKYHFHASHNPESRYSLRKILGLRPRHDRNGDEKEQEEEEDILLLLIAGIREVKDVLYLYDAMSRWQNEEDCLNEAQGNGHRKICLCVVGPILDKQYAERVISQAEKSKCFKYVKEIPVELVYESIKESNCVVNSSKSEGLSNAILESFMLSRLVIARSIPGNRSIIKDEVNGILYDSPDEFLLKCKKLFPRKQSRDCNNYKCSKLFIENLETKGKEYFMEYHSVENERNKYTEVANAILT